LLSCATNCALLGLTLDSRCFVMPLYRGRPSGDARENRGIN
jgi:hypothetical protein